MNARVPVDEHAQDVLEDKIESSPIHVEDASEAGYRHTLGHVRLRDKDTQQIILTPAPSLDPNDPLKWSQKYKIGVSILVCLAMVMCNFMAAGPTIAMVNVAQSFGGGPDTDLAVWIPKVAYFFNISALTQGVGNLFWVPVMIKYGRRPVYIASFVIYFFMIIGSGAADTYAGELIVRLFLGFAGGAGECLAPLTLTDIFFLHERGLQMAMYNAALSMGVSFGCVISGLIVINYTWRTIYWVGSALVGFTLVLVIFVFPETAYERTNNPLVVDPRWGVEIEESSDGTKTAIVHTKNGVEHLTLPKKNSYLQSLRPWDHRKYTEESLWRMMVRPLGLIILPPVFWATIVMSVTIGFLVAISSNIANAMVNTYGFAAYEAGLLYIGGLLGCGAAILLGGNLSDWVADYFTKRNGGIREPEMRLPAMVFSVIAAPLSLILYGFAIENKWHWIVPTISLFLISFAVVQGTNVSFTYCIDSYRPIAGEVTVTQLCFKSCFGFLLSFYTNVWVEEGYALAYGTMAAISGGCLLLFIPMYFWGKRIRIASMKWVGIRTLVEWDNDREVGE
ncbi:major facilitator superfamily domain-containing protein [Xylariales sp. PMI_506]|nr:major facilitator superfamily domain-containing protein [Xylariales sp. PMI_506]